MDIVEDQYVRVVDDEPAVQQAAEEEADELDEDDVPVECIWPELTPRAAHRYKTEIDRINATFNDEIDMFDTTMVSEYSQEIFDYMSKLEVSRRFIEEES
jgi:hypothetical protein